MSNFSPPDSLASYVGEGQQLFGYGFTLYPGRADALSIAYAGHKYGDSTTWSLSCDDSAGFGWVTEDSGSPFFDPVGAIPVTYGVANSSTVSRFGNTSLFFPASGTNEYFGKLILPSGCGAIAANSPFSFEFWINVPVGGGFSQFFAGSWWPAISCTFPANTWAHFAASRKSNILRLFLNGVKFYEALSTGAMDITGFGYAAATNSGHSAFYLDSIGFSNNYGHYDGVDFTPQNVPFYNVPTSVGARLQINYTVATGEAYGTRITPAEADSQWNKTVLLVQGKGPVGSKNIVDAKGRRLFNQADVTYSDAQSRNGDTSLFFNGSSAKLAIEPSRNLDLIDGDFTIEMWVYPTVIRDMHLLNRWGDTSRCFALTINASGVVAFIFNDLVTNTDTTITGPVPVTPNTWSFVSVCRSGNDYRVSLNGTGGTTVTTTKTPARLSTRMYQGGGYSGDSRSWDGMFVVGASTEDGAYPSAYYSGFMEDLRITNGFARYQSLALYPVPAAAFLPTGSGAEGDPYWPDVALLLHFDEPNGTVANIREAKGHKVAISGAGYVTSSGQYGGAYQRGSWSNLTVPYGSEFDFSTGDFTYEAWVSNLAGGEWCGNTHGPGVSGWQLSYSGVENPASSKNKGVLQWSQWNSSGVQDIAFSPLYLFYGERSRWHHIAVVRRGNDITIFVDGVGNTTTITRRPALSTNAIYLVGTGNNDSCAFGRTEEIRITRVARYSQDFKVPTAAFPEISFSYGNATVPAFYGFIPGEVKSAAQVPGAIVPLVYSAIKPAIIGKPSVYGQTFSYGNPIVTLGAKGGEGFTGSVGFGEVIESRQAISHGQVFYMNDEAIAQPVRGVASAWSVVDEAYAMLAAVGIRESMTFSETAPLATQCPDPLTEYLTLASSTGHTHGVVVAVGVNFTSAAERAWHENVLEALTLSMPLSAAQAVNAEDALTLAGDTSHAAHRTATSGMGWSTTASPQALLKGDITDALHLHGAPSLALTLFASVDEGVALNDIPAQQLLFQAMMQEGMGFSSFFVSPAFTAWAMNTRNAAVSQYANFNYNSFAEMGGRYLGANDQGLFWMDGLTDASRPVNSRIKTGIIQPNGNKLAGVLYAYLGMRGDGQFTVTVTDEAGGSYNYTLDATNMETSRVVFGRGLRTRYFTFTLESKGQDFDLDNVEFVTTDMTRKLQR